MKRLYILLFCLSYTSWITAQDATEIFNMYSEISAKIVKGDVPNYLISLKEFEQNEDKFTGTFAEQLVLESRSSLYSFIGDHQKALEMYQPLMPKDNMPVDSLGLEGVKAKNARDIILQKAKDHRIVIINENHHIPLHRAFTHSLLEDLHQQGFKYLALEDMSTTETEINERKFPIKRSGYYMLEPVFGNMVRTALQTGYEVVPYDFHAFMEFGQRDSLGATYLKKIFDENPDAKMLIHLGHEHLNENDKTIAYWIKKYTGFDPLTINQIDLTEKGSPEYDNKNYQYITQTIAPKESSILMKNGNAWILPKRKDANDLQVFHPKTTYQNNRPNWLFDLLKRKAYEVNAKDFEMNSNFLLQAFYKGEPDNAIPVDQTLVKKAGENVTLALPSGSFVLKMVDVSGNVLKNWEVAVD